MMFIETCGDVLLPVGRIATIGPEHAGREGGRYRTITTVDGSQFEIGAASPCLKNLLGTVVKGDPGYELLACSPPIDEEFEFSRQPIIAWRIGNDCAPEPITPGDMVSGDCVTAVLCPNGTVTSFDGDFATLKEWQEEEIRLWAASKAAE